MALALVKLTKHRSGRIYEFLDYLSADVAKLDVFIEGSEHRDGEYSIAEIVRIFEEDDNKT